MPRSSRILKPLGVYHIFNRANNRRTINLADQTFDYFISILSNSKSKFNLNIFGYCLMSNHYHLLIQTIEPNLDKFMKYFGENYAKYINKQTNGNGPVFSSRYNSKLISENVYFLQVLRYIHLNPVNAGKAAHVTDYPWSSISEYLDLRKGPVETSLFLSHFLNLNDFINYHEMGNTKEITSFFNRKNIPSIVNSKTLNNPFVIL